MNPKMLRVALFIDGAFFMKVNTFYRYYHDRRTNINFSGLTNFIREEVAKYENQDSRYVQITEAHWFRGRYSTVQLEKKYPDDGFRFQQMINERKLDDLFMYQNIIQHVYPVQVDPKTGLANEKGIDVWLSLEAYELAVLKNYDVMVLLAGDSDYVPLIRKINGLGTRVMMLGWDIEYETTNSVGKTFRVVTRTSQSLIEECSYPVMMDKIIEDRSNRNNGIVNGIFG